MGAGTVTIVSTEDHRIATRLVTLGRQAKTPGAGLNAPLELTSTYHAGGAVNYARAGNPTWTAFEDALGSLEGGDALVFASGLAACAAVLSLVPAGGVVVAPASSYNGVVATLEDGSAAGHLEARFVDVADDAATDRALSGADLLWFESPTNPLLDVVDIADLAARAHAAGALVAVDNTFATPLLQTPLDDGVDIVVHSVTKYLSGHSDVILGATVTRDGPLRDRLQRHRLLGGAIAGPVEVWLALRGLRTMGLRFDRACANAAELAGRLAAHPQVERVRYPGFGAMISIEVAGGVPAADAVTTGVELWVHSTSLGGVESQLERRRGQALEPETTPVNLLRLSVGIEDVEDLWADLDRALTSSANG